VNNVKSRAVSLRQLNLSYMRLRFQQYQLEINIADEYVRGSDQYPRLIETSGAGEVCGPDIHGIDHPGDRRQIQWWTRRMCGWFIHLIVDGVESGWPLVRCPRATRRNLNDISERKKYSFVFLPFFPGFLSDIVAGSAWPLSAGRRYRQSSKYTTNSNKSFFSYFLKPTRIKIETLM